MKRLYDGYKLVVESIDHNGKEEIQISQGEPSLESAEIKFKDCIELYKTLSSYNFSIILYKNNEFYKGQFIQNIRTRKRNYA